MKKKKQTIKKILAGFCCVGLLTVTGCSSKSLEKQQDPKELYQTAVEKNSGLSELDVTMGTKITMKQGEENEEINMDLNMLMSGYNTRDLKYQVESKTDLFGQSVESTMFYTDGYYYIETNGQKIKYPYDMEKVMELIQKNQSNMVSADAMSELTAEKEGENTRLNFIGNPEKMTQYTGELLEGIQGAVEGVEYSIEKASGSYLINPEGYYIESAVDMDMTMKISGTTIGVNTKVTSQVNHPGKKVEVHVPEDLSSYEEVSQDIVS